MKKEKRINIRKILSALPRFKTEKEFLEFAYSVTRDGRIIRKIDGKELSIAKGPKGYSYIRLCNPQFSKNKDKRKPYKVHRLVAMFYLKDYSERLQVNHKNGNKSDNRVENLEMVTNQENVVHAWHTLDTSKRKKRLSKALKSYWKTHEKIIDREWYKNQRKRVGRYIEGRLDKEYGCITDAAKDVGCSISAISYAVIHGGKRKGYEWKRI